MRDVFNKFSKIFYVGVGVFTMGFGAYALAAFLHISGDKVSIKTAKIALEAGIPFYVMGLGGILMLTPVLIQILSMWINRNK